MRWHGDGSAADAEQPADGAGWHTVPADQVCSILWSQNLAAAYAEQTGLRSVSIFVVWRSEGSTMNAPLQ